MGNIISTLDAFNAPWINLLCFIISGINFSQATIVTALRTRLVEIARALKAIFRGDGGDRVFLERFNIRRGK
jgi:hypothetical protein